MLEDHGRRLSRATPFAAGHPDAVPALEALRGLGGGHRRTILPETSLGWPLANDGSAHAASTLRPPAGDRHVPARADAGLLALDVSIAAALALAGTIVLAITVVVHALSGA